jgi:hypothetical protein
VLTGKDALPFVLGRPPDGFTRSPKGSFGEILVTPAP